VVTTEVSDAEPLSAFRTCAPNAAFINLYGSTGGTIYCTDYRILATSCKHHNGMIAIGKPFEGIDARIMDADGDIIYCGRKDSQIKTQGFRIELSEIEHVAKIFFNSGCRVVVIPKCDNGNQCELHLVIEKKYLDKQQMEEYLCSRFPYYMIPKHMHCLEQFPLNTSSKTDRQRIQELI